MLRAAALYAVVAFAAGFVLGAVRVALVAPRFGPLAAVALETPLMLAVSWLACGLALRRFPVHGRRQSLAMGAVAFGLLMAAELALGVLAFGQTPAGFLRALVQPPGALGLAAQLAFALLPALRTGVR
jgi:hypothetical protein